MSGKSAQTGARELNAADSDAVEERSRPTTPIIYEVVRREGEEEMDRPLQSLWWSGAAGGLSISFSLLVQAVIQIHLAPTPWRPLIVDLGYPVGFLIVILARQQLFTETTVTAVLPVVADLTARNLARMGRLWGIVLAANIAGTLAAALFWTFTPAIGADLRAAMVGIASQITQDGQIELFSKAICAGFLIAAMVWLIPSAEGAKVHVIVLMTYLVSAGGFAHIVAGSEEAWMLILAGKLGLGAALTGFALPVLLGNMVGGTALFALLSYAQVAKEIGG